MKNDKSLTPFPEEVLWNILEYCLEDGRDGSYIPQSTLASALRVNTIFYLLAGSILYHSPTVMDINSFFLGSDRYIPPEGTNSASRRTLDSATLESIKKGNTKLPLLKHVTQFRFLPRSVPVEGVDIEEQSSLEYCNRIKRDQKYSEGIGKTYEDGFELVKKIRNIKREYEKEGREFLIMPILKGISIGSDLIVHNPEEHRVVKIIEKLYDNWGTAVVNLRLHLWEILNRNGDGIEWCEWQNGGLPLMELENPEYIDRTRIVPRVFTIHTDLLDNIPLVWGCTNRIVIRRKHDENYWSRRKYRSLGKRIPVESDLDHDTPEPESYEGDGLLPYDEHSMMEEYEIISLIFNSIYDSHPKWFNKKIKKSILTKEIEDKTVFEIDGFEGICLPEEGNYDYHWITRGQNEWDRDPDVDVRYVDEELRNAGFPINGSTDPSSGRDQGVVTSNSHSDSDEDDAENHDDQDVNMMDAGLVVHNIRLHSVDDDDDDDHDRFQVVPPPGHPPTSEEHYAKMKLWLKSIDYQMIKSLHESFQDKRRTWKNSPDSQGPKIRYLPFRELADCKGCGLSGTGWV